MRIRNAIAADCVALYKLIVHEEQKAGFAPVFDEAARIAHILHVIQTGFVLVVEGKSGRILASVGFASSNPGYLQRNTLSSAWYFAATVLQGTNAVQAMIKKVVAFAQLHSVAVNATLPLHLTELRTLLQDYGFGPVAQVYSLAPVEQETDEPEAPAARPEIPRPRTSSGATPEGGRGQPDEDDGDDPVTARASRPAARPLERQGERRPRNPPQAAPDVTDEPQDD